MLVSLSGTGQTAPNEWLNPQNGVNYQVVVQAPQYSIDSMQSLARTPTQTHRMRFLQPLLERVQNGRN
jgi:hypothetical protein